MTTSPDFGCNTFLGQTGRTGDRNRNSIRVENMSDSIVSAVAVSRTGANSCMVAELVEVLAAQGAPHDVGVSVKEKGLEAADKPSAGSLDLMEFEGEPVSLLEKCPQGVGSAEAREVFLRAGEAAKNHEAERDIDLRNWASAAWESWSCVESHIFLQREP